MCPEGFICSDFNSSPESSRCIYRPYAITRKKLEVLNIFAKYVNDH